MEKLRVAIVGATGLVGRTFIKVLEEKNLPIESYALFASKKTAGTKLSLLGKEYEVQELTENSFDSGFDYALFSAGGEVSKKYAPIAASKGCIVIDNSSYFRMDKDVPLVVPEVNFEDVYTGGDGLISATHDIGDFEILRLYNLALQNNGEVSCYYTYDREKQYFHQLPPDSKDSDKNQDTDFSNSDTNPDSENSDDEYEKKEIGIEFFNTRPAFFMKNDRYVDDFLYAKLVTLDDGTELMVISDVQVTPLDSTVKILKSQLEITSLIAFIVALIVSFLVSRHISAPIVQLNNSALELARGKFDTEFTGKGYREIEQLSDTLNYTASELGKVEQFRRLMKPIGLQNL